MDYETKKLEAALKAGKILMQWKTKEVSETGAVKKDFSDSVSAVKQNVSEAIVAEEVPPGYHDTIRKYFDTIDESVAKPVE